MKKPYDTTPIAMNTAEEPALAYAYTHTGGEVRGAGCDVGARHASPMTAATALTEEQIELLNERLEGIEDGTAVFLSHEEVMRNLRQYAAERKKQRKAMLEYV